MGKYEEVLQEQDQILSLSLPEGKASGHGKYYETLRELDCANGLLPGTAFTLRPRGYRMMLLASTKILCGSWTALLGWSLKRLSLSAPIGIARCCLGEVEGGRLDLDRADCLEPEKAFPLNHHWATNRG